MTLSIWLDVNDPPVREKTRHQVDVAIVGGGLIGAGCAHYLAKRKVKSVILEAGTPASGASGRNGGFVLRGIQSYYNIAVKRYGRDNAKFVYAFTEENQRLIKEFLERVGANDAYEACGSYLLACSLEELDELAESAEMMKQDGFAVDYLKEDPLDRDFYGALLNAGDIGIHPVKLVRALIDQSGVEVFSGEQAIRLQTDGGKLLLHCASKIIECDRVLVATNAYAPFLDPYFLDKVTPARGQILVTKPLRERILDKLCYANYGFEYFRQLPDNRLLLGGCRQNFSKEEMGYADMVTKPVQTALENCLKDRFPDVAGVRIDYRFSGVMGFTSDGLPLVGEIKKVPGAFFAVGFNGHGLGYGMNMSRLLVDVAMDGLSPGIFNVDRAPLVVAR